MIELYYWPTPHGHKIAMFLEEARTEIHNPRGGYQRRRSVQTRLSRHDATR